MQNPLLKLHPVVAVRGHQRSDTTMQFGQTVHRVLKPGGWFCACTPNRWGEDAFPTCHKLNFWHQFRRHFADSEWKRVIYTMNDVSAYFGRSVFFWRLAQIMFRLTPPGLEAVFLFFAHKRESEKGLPQ